MVTISINIEDQSENALSVVSNIIGQLANESGAGSTTINEEVSCTGLGTFHSYMPYFTIMICSTDCHQYNTDIQ